MRNLKLILDMITWLVNGRSVIQTQVCLAPNVSSSIIITMVSPKQEQFRVKGRSPDGQSSSSKGHLPTKLFPHKVHTRPSKHRGGTLPIRRTWGGPRLELHLPHASLPSGVCNVLDLMNWFTELPHHLPYRPRGKGKHSNKAQINWSPQGSGCLGQAS